MFKLVGYAHALFALFLATPILAATVVYQNDFEAPIGFVSGFASGPTTYFDASQQQINSLYGSNFGQTFTVETLNASGASYTGAGLGNDYVLGMLSTLQSDRLWLTFEIGSDDYVNVAVDLSAIDLNGSDGLTLVAPGVAPLFELSVFDGPATAGIPPQGALLDSTQIVGTSTTLVERYEFDWTTHLVTLSAVGHASGTVTLQIDLVDGGYAAFDNLTIARSDVPGDVTPVPLLSGLMPWLMGLALVSVGVARGADSTREG